VQALDDQSVNCGRRLKGGVTAGLEGNVYIHLWIHRALGFELLMIQGDTSIDAGEQDSARTMDRLSGVAQRIERARDGHQRRGRSYEIR
jgi:hypothetical protein